MPDDPHPMVLIVEDHADARASLGMLLSLSGYRTAEAADGQQALDYLHRNPAPCMIVLDLRMPVMSGIEFLRHRKRDPALAAIPVLLWSGESGIDHEAACHGVGYCRKPADPLEILDAIARCCKPGGRPA